MVAFAAANASSVCFNLSSTVLFSSSTRAKVVSVSLTSVVSFAASSSRATSRSVSTSCLRSNSRDMTSLNSGLSNSRRRCAMAAPCSFESNARSSRLRGRMDAMRTYHSRNCGWIKACGFGEVSSKRNAPKPAGAPPREVHANPPVFFSREEESSSEAASSETSMPLSLSASARYSAEDIARVSLVASPPTPAKRASRSSSES
mmetsp:Transcript_228/g.922  ORF Transcript_228/g.922 Transcript_228/m.922 type:complete len:203 (+) Transcript_228:117-725(+)